MSGLPFTEGRMAQALDQGNCGIARSRGKEAEVKPVRRRTEMPYQAGGADELAQHSEVRCSAPEVDDPVAQGEFTSLLREICAPGSPATAGAPVREDRRVGTEVRLNTRRSRREARTKFRVPSSGFRVEPSLLASAPGSDAQAGTAAGRDSIPFDATLRDSLSPQRGEGRGEGCEKP